MTLADNSKRKRIIVPSIAEPPPGFWSNCIVVDRLIIMAGMVGKDEENNTIPGDAYEQSVLLFRRMKAFIEAAGAQMNDIIKMNAFIADIRHRDVFVKARQEFFTGDFPPCTVVGGTLFAKPEYLIEVDCWAIIGSGH